VAFIVITVPLIALPVEAVIVHQLTLSTVILCNASHLAVNVVFLTIGLSKSKSVHIGVSSSVHVCHPIKLNHSLVGAVGSVAFPQYVTT
jgi:hypothetical protein